MPDVQFEIGLDLVAILSAMAFFGYKIGKYYVMPAYENHRKMASAIGKIDKIYEQINPNGGSSMFDTVQRIENRLIFVEQKTGVYLQDARHSIFDVNKKGKIIGVNRTFCRLLGATEKELMGGGWLNFVNESTAVGDRFNHAIANEIEFKMTFDMVKTNGEIVHVNCSANPLRSTLSQDIIGYLGIIEETIA